MKLMLILIFAFSTNLLAQYRVAADVSGNGGNRISAQSFVITSTIGQPLISRANGNSFDIISGFWKPEQILTPVNEDNVSPVKEYLLTQNYPNPFNPTTIIEYQVPEISDVSLKVYDILGSEIRSLVKEEKKAGNYKVKFNAIDLASGIYFYRIEARSKISNKQYSKVVKMILLK